MIWEFKHLHESRSQIVAVCKMCASFILFGYRWSVYCCRLIKSFRFPIYSHFVSLHNLPYSSFASWQLYYSFLIFPALFSFSCLFSVYFWRKWSMVSHFFLFSVNDDFTVVMSCAMLLCFCTSLWTGGLI